MALLETSKLQKSLGRVISVKCFDTKIKYADDKEDDEEDDKEDDDKEERVVERAFFDLSRGDEDCIAPELARYPDIFVVSITTDSGMMHPRQDLREFNNITDLFLDEIF
jgi:hypothetical protein